MSSGGLPLVGVWVDIYMVGMDVDVSSLDECLCGTDGFFPRQEGAELRAKEKVPSMEFRTFQDPHSRRIGFFDMIWFRMSHSILSTIT